MFTHQIDPVELKLATKHLVTMRAFYQGARDNLRSANRLKGEFGRKCRGSALAHLNQTRARLRKAIRGVEVALYGEPRTS